MQKALYREIWSEITGLRPLLLLMGKFYSASSTAPRLALVTSARYWRSQRLFNGLTIGVKSALRLAISSSLTSNSIEAMGSGHKLQINFSSLALIRCEG